MLTIPNGTKPFTVFIDACGRGPGEVPMLEKKRVVYARRKLKDHEKKYPVYD